MTELEAATLQDYIALIRNRTTNTIEEWNLMLDAEEKLQQAVRESGGNGLSG